MSLSSDFPSFTPPYTQVTSADNQDFYTGQSWKNLDDSNTYTITWPSADDTSYWNLLYENYYLTNADDFEENTEYYQNFFGQIWTNYSIASEESNTTILNISNWQSYLESEEVVDQTVNIFLYSLGFLNDIISDVQNAMLYQTQRNSSINYATDDAISAMSDATSAIITDEKMTNSATSFNTNVGQAISVYQSYSSQASSYNSQGLTNTGSFNNASSDSQSLLDSFLSEVKGIITSLFQ
jgi:hypothetical protein